MFDSGFTYQTKKHNNQTQKRYCMLSIKGTVKIVLYLEPGYT